MEFLQVIAAVASAIAAIAAAWAAYYGPTRAAELAEDLRTKNEDANEERRIKLNVFANLLGDRRHWARSVESIRALNTIDLAFRQAPDVREAWASYQQVFLDINAYPLHEIERREDALLAEMAKNLGLSNAIRGSDFGRFSNPTWRSKIYAAQVAQADELLARTAVRPQQEQVVLAEPIAGDAKD